MKRKTKEDVEAVRSLFLTEHKTTTEILELLPHMSRATINRWIKNIQNGYPAKALFGENGNICVKCAIPLTNENRLSRKDGRQNNQCQKCAHKAAYTNKKKLILDNKLSIITSFGGKCIVCDYNICLAAMVFHHRDPFDKLFEVDQFNMRKYSYEEVLLEAQKCDLLCQVCHTEYHNPNAFDWHQYVNNIKDSSQFRYRKIKSELVAAMGGKCLTCGYDDNLSSLVFHHTAEREKSFSLDAHNLMCYTRAEIEAEAKKCNILCHNCHMEYHYPHLSGLL